MSGIFALFSIFRTTRITEGTTREWPYVCVCITTYVDDIPEITELRFPSIQVYETWIPIYCAIEIHFITTIYCIRIKISNSNIFAVVLTRYNCTKISICLQILIKFIISNSYTVNQFNSTSRCIFYVWSTLGELDWTEIK